MSKRNYISVFVTLSKCLLWCAPFALLASCGVGLYSVSPTAPIAVTDTAFTQQNTSVSISALSNDSDPLDREIALVASFGTSNGSTSVSGNEVSYTPNTGFSGTDTFNYVIENDRGERSVGTIVVSIYPFPSAFTWIGGAGNNNWSNGANWQGGTPPNNTQIALLTGACESRCNIVLDTNIDVQGLNLDSSFLGTLIQGTSQITVGTSDFTQQNGTFSGGSGTIDINGALSIGGGDFQATSGNLSIGFFVNQTNQSDGFVITGGSFDANGGTVTFDGLANGDVATIDASAINVPDTVTFNNLTLNLRDTNPGNGGPAQAAVRLTDGDTLVVEGDFRMTDGTIFGGNIDLRGNLIAGRTNGDVKAEAGTTVINITASGDQEYTDQGGQLPPIVINKPSGTFRAAGGTTSISMNKFTLQSGTFEAPTGTMSVGGFNVDKTNQTDGFVVTGGTFDPNGGTLRFNGISNGDNFTVDVIAVNVPGSLTVNNLTIAVLDANPSNGGPNDAAVQFIDGDTLRVTGDLTIDDGQLFNGNIDLLGNLFVNSASGDVQAEGGTTTVTFAGSTDQEYTYVGGNLPVLRVNKSAGTARPAAGTTALSTFKFVLESGTFQAPTGNLSIGFYAGTTDQTDGFTVTGGTFDPNGGTLRFVGSSLGDNGTITDVTVIDVPTTLTVNNITVDVLDANPGFGGANDSILRIATGDTITVQGNLQINDGVIDGGTLNLLGNVVFDQTDGDVRAEGGTTQLTFSKVGTQTYSVTAGADELDGAFQVNPTSTLQMLSNMNLNGGGQVITIDAGTLDRNGFSVTGTTNTINGGMIIN